MHISFAQNSKTSEVSAIEDNSVILSRSDSLEMLQLSSQLNQIVEKADALNFLGIVEDINSHYSKALSYYTQSLKLAKQSNSTKTIASINNNIGLIEWKLGHLKEALTFFFEALKQPPK